MHAGGAAGPGRSGRSEGLWGDIDPAKRQDRFSAVVSNLRGRVRDKLGRRDVDVVIRDGDAYRLEVELYDVDLWRFHQALAALGACSDDDERASCLGTALSA